MGIYTTTKRWGIREKQIDSLNHIRGKRLPSNLRNGSSIYIDDTTTLQIVNHLSKKKTEQNNVEKAIQKTE